MDSNGKSFEFAVVIRDYHAYQKCWQQELKKTLVCVHERGNEFDVSSVKTVCLGVVLLLVKGNFLNHKIFI